MGDITAKVTQSYQKELKPNAKSWVIEEIKYLTPAYFHDMTTLIDSFRAIDALVYLITLRGVFQVDQSLKARVCRLFGR